MSSCDKVEIETVIFSQNLTVELIITYLKDKIIQFPKLIPLCYFELV